jgi:hypothetical protein
LNASKADKEYLPITGLAEFTSLAAKLAYGKDSAPLNEKRVRKFSFSRNVAKQYVDCSHPIYLGHWCSENRRCFLGATL